MVQMSLRLKPPAHVQADNAVGSGREVNRNVPFGVGIDLDGRESVGVDVAEVVDQHAAAATRASLDRGLGHALFPLVRVKPDAGEVASVEGDVGWERHRDGIGRPANSLVALA